MSKVSLLISLNFRAFETFKKLSGADSYTGIVRHIEQVLLKHLNETPGVDLSQSPYSEPKGVSNGKEE